MPGKNRLCVCHKQASFALAGEKRPVWCATCPDRPQDAVNIRKPLCACDRRSKPVFGRRGDKRPTWCAQCPGKPADAVDILSRRCLCPLWRQPSFGRIGDKKPTWCAGCPDKPQDAVDIVNVNQGKCSTCDPEQFKVVRLKFQSEIKHALDADAILADYFTYDRPLFGGAFGLERPDWAWECSTHLLVLECDEGQHLDRQEWCECARMVNILGIVNAAALSRKGNTVSQSLPVKPVIFLRYNPHAYVGTDGRRADPKFGPRMKVLKQQIVRLRKPRQDLPVLSAVQLFFDGYDSRKKSELVPLL
ncbi:hypothetical protein DFJ74DRAFT_705880 [Hyaloraphidium curvatum]|nr:hypothetical protein DFJ74DRAFT_705880 [Hyaloraphidium curvatum]